MTPLFPFRTAVLVRRGQETRARCTRLELPDRQANSGTRCLGGANIYARSSKAQKRRRTERPLPRLGAAHACYRCLRPLQQSKEVQMGDALTLRMVFLVDRNRSQPLPREYPMHERANALTDWAIHSPHQSQPKHSRNRSASRTKHRQQPRDRIELEQGGRRRERRPD